VIVRKGKSEQFHVKEKQEFWEKGRKTKNKGEEPIGEPDSVKTSNSQFLGENLISWASKRQATIAMSTVEA